ncbi:MAG: hypothetical protein M1832_003401 [Thelocarpon impressellum]|nr:MAG: hypothetical protein M1832_003401 [Thelocarpon impressellum]
MEPPPKPSSTSLFQVYLRLKPPTAQQAVSTENYALYPDLSQTERYLTVEEPVMDSMPTGPTHITVNPPNDLRRRAVERFAFTKVFEEDADQLDIFKGAGVVPLIEGVLEANLTLAATFLDSVYGEAPSERAGSRAPTPMLVGRDVPLHPSSMGLYPSLLGINTGNSPRASDNRSFNASPAVAKGLAKLRFASKDVPGTPSQHRHRKPQRPSALPQLPGVEDVQITVDESMEYAVLISMYEVYNDRIFDLLPSQVGQPSAAKLNANKDSGRRPLLFKSTEHSPDRKVVAGLRKVVCGSLAEALMVLETGLMERRVSGTGSNSTSSRSHGFFCVEVKRRSKTSSTHWQGSMLTVVDLAGSERARNAKTAGATLAEAGKINESLMYLGQCLQMQSDNNEGNKPSLVPFRQCKLTELLFSNSFPSASTAAHHALAAHRNSQKAVMIVTADPLGDFNATSQILRYSALAREVTVPRIPSVTSTIFSGATAKTQQSSSGRTTPSSFTTEGVDFVVQEIARLSDEVEKLKFRLEDEETRSEALEGAWRDAEARCLMIEQQTRVECVSEMDKRLELEARRWTCALGDEADRNDEHLDRKIDLLQTIQIHEDTPQPESERIEEVEKENEALRHKIERLERELQVRSPSKRPQPAKRVLSVTTRNMTKQNAEASLMDQDVAPPPTITKKTPRTQRKQPFLSSPKGFTPEADLDEASQVTTIVTTPTRKTRSKKAPKGGDHSDAENSFAVMSKGISAMTLQGDESGDETTLRPLASATTAEGKTPRTGTGKKVRKFTTRKWDLGAEEDLSD